MTIKLTPKPKLPLLTYAVDKVAVACNATTLASSFINEKLTYPKQLKK